MVTTLTFPDEARLRNAEKKKKNPTHTDGEGFRLGKGLKIIPSTYSRKVGTASLINFTTIKGCLEDQKMLHDHKIPFYSFNFSAVAEIRLVFRGWSIRGRPKVCSQPSMVQP